LAGNRELNLLFKKEGFFISSHVMPFPQKTLPTYTIEAGPGSFGAKWDENRVQMPGATSGVCGESVAALG